MKESFFDNSSHIENAPENNHSLKDVEESENVFSPFEPEFINDWEKHEGQLEQAEVFLRSIFKQYNPEQHASDIGFFSAAYELNRIFCPHLRPENTGFLEKTTRKRVEPLLQGLSEEYPQAVRRFRHVFLLSDNKKTETSEQAFDPNRPVRTENRAKAIQYYHEHPREAYGFIFTALKNENHALGIAIAHNLIQSEGWDTFLKTALEEKAGFNQVLECVIKLSSPNNLPTEALEQKLSSHIGDDTHWIALQSYLENRKDTESASSMSMAECRDFLGRYHVPFFNIEKTRSATAELLKQDPEAYYGFLEDLHQGLRAMWTEYPGPRHAIHNRTDGEMAQHDNPGTSREPQPGLCL